jgi:hypothetical protein
MTTTDIDSPAGETPAATTDNGSGAAMLEAKYGFKRANLKGSASDACDVPSDDLAATHAENEHPGFVLDVSVLDVDTL